MALINNRLSRPTKTIIILVIGFALSAFTWLQTSHDRLSNFASFGSQRASVHLFDSLGFESHPRPQTPEAATFWKDFSKMLIDGDPVTVQKTLESSETAGWVVFDHLEKGSQLPDLLHLSDVVIEGLSRKHAQTVETIGRIASNLPYVAGTRGIVTTAGPTADAILTTSLRMVRKSGSTLPIEIWYYDQREYDSYMCEQVWAPLNAQCKIMRDYLPPETEADGEAPLEISHHFQMKILSLLFSSFEQALFLDCDLFPVNNPDSIFITEPFISKGWVLWPDYWASTNSPDYFKIVNRKPIDQYIRQSTESGAMLVNKKTHAAAMLLAAYYNRYGPQHYYWLLSQGAIGHGDKDTYMAAIEFFGFTVYQVDNPPRRIGYRCDGNERAIASGQSHPYDDYIITSTNASHARPGLLHDLPKPRVLFVHGNLPKMDAVSILDWMIPDNWDDQLRCDHGKGPVHRQWGSKQFTQFTYGYDAEKSMWDQMRWLACTHEAGVRRWREGTTIFCDQKAADGGWCPKSNIGKNYMFETPRPNVCHDITKLYEELLPDETYDPTLPKNGTPERPWGSIAATKIEKS